MDIDTFERQKTFTYDLARFDGLPEFIDEIHARHMKLITIVVRTCSICMCSCSYSYSYVGKRRTDRYVYIVVHVHTLVHVYVHVRTYIYDGGYCAREVANFGCYNT